MNNIEKTNDDYLANEIRKYFIEGRVDELVDLFAELKRIIDKYDSDKNLKLI